MVVPFTLKPFGDVIWLSSTNENQKLICSCPVLWDTGSPTVVPSFSCMYRWDLSPSFPPNRGECVVLLKLMPFFCCLLVFKLKPFFSVFIKWRSEYTNFNPQNFSVTFCDLKNKIPTPFHVIQTLLSVLFSAHPSLRLGTSHFRYHIYCSDSPGLAKPLGFFLC